MKRLFYTLLFFLPCMLIACGGSDDTTDGDNNPPVVAPPCEEPVDSRLLYNGIRLPEQWPPVRSSSSELEKGMSPFYLSDTDTRTGLGENWNKRCGIRRSFQRRGMV